MARNHSDHNLVVEIGQFMCSIMKFIAPPPTPAWPSMPYVTFRKASGSRMHEKFSLGLAVPHNPCSTGVPYWL